MPDNPRIHPTPPRPPPPPLLVPGGSVRSTKGVSVNDLGRPPKRRSSGCLYRCICSTLSVILTLLILLAILAAFFYFIFHPKAPSYSIDRLRITDFRFNLDLTLYARFNVRITARNPNTKIAIYYLKGGKISVWYSDTELCNGSFPEFYQGHRNTTRVTVALAGQHQYGSVLVSALQQQQQTGNVPLEVKVDQPVKVEVGSLRLRKVRFLVRCMLVVDSLSANSIVSIKTSNCKFKLKL